MKKTALLLLTFLALPLFAQQREAIWPKGKMPDAQDKQIAAMTDELGLSPYYWYKYVSGQRSYGTADVNNVPLWQDYVAGTNPDPTAPDAAFKITSIVLTNDTPTLSWSPDLGSARRYIIDGRPTLDID